MRKYQSITAILGGLGLAALSTAALAGGCGAPGSNCAPSVIVKTSAPHFDPMTVNIRQPMGHLRSVHYSRSPQVSITRIHSMRPMAGLSDAPHSFTQGCHATSTEYCRSGHNHSAGAPMAAPRPQVYVSPPAPTMTTSTFASQSQSRQYGDATFVPGIAHVPTSRVDRSVENNQAVLNSGRAVAQSTTLGGMGPSHSMAQMAQSSHMHSTHHFGGMQTGAPVQTGQGTYQSPVSGDGTYWEQTSGPTMIDGTMATKVLCKRALPRQVVNPVIGVPVPVPVTCAGMPVQAMNNPVMAGGPSFPPTAQNGWTF